MYDKEKIYDEQISHLMGEIIEICKREKIPMAAQFYLKEQDESGEPMYCKSAIIPAKKDMNAEAHEQMECIYKAMEYGGKGKPFIMAATITTE